MKTILAIALLATTAVAAQAAVTAADAFASLKKLEGHWRGPSPMKGMPPGNTIFHVTAGGSAVEERILPGTKMEMLSVYHMDKGNLLMTHYCAAGNQPRMKLNTRTSTAGELVFDFDGGTNMNPRRDMHMHSQRMTLPRPTKAGPQKLTTSGTSWEGGKEKDACTIAMTRVR